MRSFSRAEKVIFIVICLLNLSRLIHLDHAPFILDEVLLQLRLDESFKNSSVPLFGLVGSAGMPYGPVALWIYGFGRWVSSYPEFAVFIQVVSVCLAMVFLFRVMRLIGDRVIALSVCMLASTSSYLMFYSRMAWDNTFLILLSIMAVDRVLVIRKFGEGRYRSLGLGLILGLNFGVHLMSLPLILTVFLMSYDFIRIRRVIVGFVIVVSPYLYGILYQQTSLPQLVQSAVLPLTLNQSVSVVVSNIEGLFRFLGVHGFGQYFLNEPSWDWEPLHWVVKVGCFVFAIQCMRWIPVIWRRQFHRLNDASFVGLLMFIAAGCLTVVQLLRRAPSLPHYSMSLWMLGYIFLGLWVASEKGLRRRILNSVMVALTLVNILYLIHWRIQIGIHAGTRAVGYSATIENMRKISHEICQFMSLEKKATVRLDLDRVIIFPVSILYFLKLDRVCENRTIEILNSNQRRTLGDIELNYSDRDFKDAHLTMRVRTE